MLDTTSPKKNEDADKEYMNTYITQLHQHTWRNVKEIKHIRENLLQWYDKYQRILPWRIPSNHTLVNDTLTKIHKDIPGQRAYEVWVSEIMLQQTQVVSVIPYYDAWMTQWPTVHHLAETDVEDVVRKWTGLGYYSRAKRLHEAARLVVDKFNGQIPQDVIELERDIPGIGPYTAGAIVSIAYNKPVPAVDGNVIRVLSRSRAIGGDPKNKMVIERHWDLARELVDPIRPGDFNQALMELGAIVCTPNNPICQTCPISDSCMAYAEAIQNQQPINTLENYTKIRKRRNHLPIAFDDNNSKGNDLKQQQRKEELSDCLICSTYPVSSNESLVGVTQYPRKSIKKQPRMQTNVTAVVVNVKPDSTESYLIVQRPSTGLLANMWDFPNVEVDSTLGDNERSIQLLTYLYTLGLTNNMTIDAIRTLGTLTHLFTHIKQSLDVKCIYITEENWSKSPQLERSPLVNMMWISADGLTTEALSTGMKKVFTLFVKSKEPIVAITKKKRQSSDRSKRTRKNIEQEEDEIIKQPSIKRFFAKQ